MVLNTNPLDQPERTGNDPSALGCSASLAPTEDPIALAWLQACPYGPPGRLSSHLGLGGPNSQLDQKSQGHPAHRCWRQALAPPPSGPVHGIGLSKLAQGKQPPHHRGHQLHPQGYSLFPPGSQGAEEAWHDDRRPLTAVCGPPSPVYCSTRSGATLYFDLGV